MTADRLQAAGSQQQIRPRRNREKTLWHYLGLSVSTVLLILVASTAVLVIVLPAVVSGTPLTVLTNSMAPKLPPGTLVVIRPTPIDEIGIGDVLTYQIESGKPALISHRVVTRSMDTNGVTTFTTKGDNNSLADPEPVQEVQIKGTVWYSFPWLGYVNNAINGSARAWIVPLIAGLLFVYGGFTVASAIAARLRKRRISNGEESVSN